MQPGDDVIAPSGRPLGQRAQATRRRLLDATAEQLKIRGLLELTVVDIARRAGTSSATFYQYFRNVGDAALALAWEVSRDVGHLCGLMEEPWEGDSGFRFARQLVDGFIVYWDRNRAVLQMRNIAAQDGDHRFREARNESLSLITDPLSEKIAQFQALGQVSSTITPYAAASALIAMMDRIGAYHGNLEERGVTRAEAVETTATIVHQTVTGRRPW